MDALTCRNCGLPIVKAHPNRRRPWIHAATNMPNNRQLVACLGSLQRQDYPFVLGGAKPPIITFAEPSDLFVALVNEVVDDGKL